MEHGLSGGNMKLPFYGVCACALLFLHCSEVTTDPDEITGPVENKAGEITKACINGSLNGIEPGDTVVLEAGFEATDPVDTAAVLYVWTLSRNGVVIAEGTGRTLEISDFEEPGQYQLDLEISYGERHVSSTVIVIVTVRYVYLDSSLAAELDTCRIHWPGYYLGQISTPWAPAYEVAFAFRQDGTYSAYNAESDQLPALYYGTDEDVPGKTWSLTDIRADRALEGNLVVCFDVGTKNVYEITGAAFSDGFDSLAFSLGGSMRFNLKRIDSCLMPPKPLPTPVVTVTGPRCMVVFRDSAQVRISGPDSLQIVYQVLPMPLDNSEWSVLNPGPLWRSDVESAVYGGPFLLRSGSGNNLILARTTNGLRSGGVTVYALYFEPGCR